MKPEEFIVNNDNHNVFDRLKLEEIIKNYDDHDFDRMKPEKII